MLVTSELLSHKAQPQIGHCNFTPGYPWLPSTPEPWTLPSFPPERSWEQENAQKFKVLPPDPLFSEPVATTPADPQTYMFFYKRSRAQTLLLQFFCETSQALNTALRNNPGHAEPVSQAPSSSKHA